MRTSLLHFAAIAFAVGSAIEMGAQPTQQLARAQVPPHTQASTPAATQHVQSESTTNPVADPRAIVVLGKARFTVLTPELIRMEWAADGKFEDHASFVFINRRLPVPKYSHEFTGGKLILKTDALTLTYSPKGDGRFVADNLTIELTVDGKPVVWRPGTI